MYHFFIFWVNAREFPEGRRKHLGSIVLSTPIEEYLSKSHVIRFTEDTPHLGKFKM